VERRRVDQQVTRDGAFCKATSYRRYIMLCRSFYQLGDIMFICQTILLIAITEDPQLSSNHALITTNSYVWNTKRLSVLRSKLKLAKEK